MSVSPLGSPLNSVLGSPIAQTHGTEVDRAQQENTNQSHRTHSHAKAEQASGIGEMEEEQEATDREVDGRRPWEMPTKPSPAENDQESPGDRSSASDPTGATGSQLDLRG